MNNIENINLLLKRIAEDDSKAFQLFYDNYYIQIYRFTSYYIKREEIREEIVSDVFLTIWQNRRNLENINNIKAYLYTVTRNRALYFINNSKDSKNVAIDEIPLGITSEYETPEEKILNRELSDTIKEAIEKLPDRCKLIFLMAKEENLKYKEIAQVLSISEKTVNAQMVIALKKLSEKIKKYIYILFGFL
jgi:RNA polymerase sigma-70 factor (ECF subfamily)